jgi:hypothetical protein
MAEGINLQSDFFHCPKLIIPYRCFAMSINPVNAVAAGCYTWSMGRASTTRLGQLAWWGCHRSVEPAGFRQLSRTFGPRSTGD